MNCDACPWDSDDARELQNHLLFKHGRASTIVCDDCKTVYEFDGPAYDVGCQECNGTHYPELANAYFVAADIWLEGNAA